MNRIGDFELEMMDMQPHYDMIYGYEDTHGIWKQHERNFDDNSKRLLLKDTRDDIIELEDDENSTAKIREIALRNNYVKKIGYNFNKTDPESNYTKELEITNMIRNCGLESDLHEEINSKKTLKPIHSNKPFEINGHDNKFIVLLDDEYFKLKPKKSDRENKIKNDDNDSNCDDDNNSIKSSSVNSVKSYSSKSSRDEKISARIRKASIIANTPTSSTISKKENVKNVPSLLNYYDQFKKFYTPKEIYDKRNNKSSTTSTSNKSTKKSIKSNLSSSSRSSTSSSSTSSSASSSFLYESLTS